MLKLIYLAFLSVCVYGYPNSPVVQDINSVKDGKVFKDLYNIIRSPALQGGLQDSKKLAASVLSRAVKVSPEDQSCACCGYNCGCCVHVDVDAIHLNSIVCVNVSYLPKDYGVSATLTIDGKTIINETVSARNPPPICAGVPYLEKFASVCLRFTDVTVSKTSFRACLKIEVRLADLVIKDIDLGCFRIPPEGSINQGKQPCKSFIMDPKGRQPIYKDIQDNQSLEKKILFNRRVQDILVKINGN